MRRTTRTALLLSALALPSLFGCSAGGLIPGGPHSLAPGMLDAIVAAESARSAVPPRLTRAIIAAESSGDPTAISPAGARGLMQLMPSTAESYGVADPFDPESNVAGGTRYLHDLLARYHQDVALAVAAYNAGPGAVDASRGIPPFPETRAYVQRVIAEYRRNSP